MAGNATNFSLTPQIQEYIDARLAEADATWKSLLDAQSNSISFASREFARDMDTGWVIICATLVFFMQAGFAMLEAGVVHPKNAQNIIFKVTTVLCLVAAGRARVGLAGVAVQVLIL